MGRKTVVKDIKTARMELLEACFEKIRGYYKISDEAREEIDNKLEVLVRVVERKGFSTKEMRGKFSGKIARKTREDIGFGLRELSILIGVDPSTISNFETGKREMRYPPKKGPKIYVEWLKDHGYNPYELE